MPTAQIASGRVRPTRESDLRLAARGLADHSAHKVHLRHMCKGSVYKADGLVFAGRLGDDDHVTSILPSHSEFESRAHATPFL